MNTHTILDFDDVGEALREQRPLRPARAYRFRYAQGNLDFRNLEVQDPVPLGRQILAAAGIHAVDGHSLYLILPSGDFESIRPDEIVDLRARGAERLVAFETDRDYKLTVNGRHVLWGKPTILGSELRVLAERGDENAIFLQVPGGIDRLIEPADHIDLRIAGVEKVIAAPNPSRTIRIIVNARPREVTKPQISFEELVALAFPGCPPGQNTVFSITFQNVVSDPKRGELGPGAVILVKNGSVINVTRTGQS